ncbi:SDR family NAD(P)-dependent oxidoreductase [Terriglobus sp. ADX1]|uniref:SDR family NAD(P)-dependent oxidoreductase n=1 Tax=Terriglobus sp. ADX1 TaxID=2794063 RepID=UPI002FE627AE
MTSSHEGLRGRRVLITGGVRRLGRAFALALANAGADVVVTTRRSDEAATDLLQAVALLGGRYAAVQCDVTVPEQVSRAVDEAASFLGGIDLLINNAGMFESAKLEDLTPEQWDRIFATNTRGPFLVAQAALPHLRSSGQGRILNIGSLGGIRPWVTHGHYCSSKAALHMLTQTMAKAWAPEVSVNAIAPGMIRFPDEPERMAGKTPMQRDGSPADVVKAVLFFASAPQFITGQVLAVDGGLGLA